MKDWKKEIFTIPNLMSFFRLILIPIYITIYLQADQSSDYALAALVLAASCFTDLIDGWIARKFHMISRVGMLLDPVADKATQFSLLLCFSLEHPVLWTLSTLFVVKEAFQLIAMLVAYKRGKMLKGALFSGKICTTVLFFSFILLVLFHESIRQPWINIITCVDGVFLLIAFTDYLLTYIKNTSMIQDINEQ